MANVNEISVPVRLKVMQDSIANFQKILDNLQPNTNNWKALSKLLNTMVSDSQKLQAQMSTPFNSQKDFNQTERTISKLEESAARFSFAIKQIQFSDLKLDQSQIEELQKYEQEIENIRNAYKKLQEDTKEKLLSNETNSNLIGNISASTLTKDFDAIEKSVDTHIKSLNSKVDEYKKNLSQFQNNIQLGDQATALTTSGLSKTSLGATIFDKYLTQLSDGNLHFKLQNGNTKKALLTEIEQMFNLTPGELQPLATRTINQINQAFQDMSKRGQLNVFDKIINRGNTAKKSTPIANDELTTLQSQLQEYRTLYAEIQRLKESSGINNFNTTNQSAITDAEQKLQKLQNTILQGITANEQYKNSTSALANEFPRVRSALGEVNAEFLRQQSVMNSFNSMKMTVANFMGFYQVLNLTKRAIKDAANHIKELDSVMNKISIVTNMDTSDLWGQIDQYSKMAQTYGTTIKGAYEVSQIYYQQGLDTADVLSLTNETLKLAKVSGLDYASTTDYMTTALRGFKMEMSEAATVVDVYSNLAANTAVSQEELAVAMSKTASSMESVGSSFEETSAMIATMVAVTRESATNIGSALKSIAARYGEMKSDPLAMTDSEGEELVYNKVDAALQSVGITLKDTEGQFRNFTDVITELAEKWDQLESTQQRYIATQFAGNRQQSRFLALVSNKDLLAENIAVAENSEDTGTVQALKALDSLESKIEQVRVAYQQFYTTIGIEDVWKGFLDGAKSVVDTLNGMPKLFGKLPIGALNAIAQVINVLKTFAFQGLQQTAFLMGKGFKAGMDSARSEIQGEAENTIQQVENTISGHESVFNQLGTKLSLALANGFNVSSKSLITDVGQKFGSTQAEINQKRDWMNRIDYLNSVRKNGETVPGQLSRGYTSIADEMKSMGLITQQAYNIITQGGPEVQRVLNMLGLTAVDVNAKWKLLGNGINVFGQALNMISLAINTTTKEGKTLSGALQMIAGVAITAGAIIKSAGEIAASGWKAIPFVAIASGIIAIINGVSQAIQAQSAEAKIEELTAKAEELSNKAKQLQSDYKTIDSSIKKIKELEKTRYDSAEAAEEYQTAVDKLAETYPLLVSSYDSNNEAVLNVTYMEDLLAAARDKSAAATLRAVEAEAETAKAKTESYKNDLKNANNDWLSADWTGHYSQQIATWWSSVDGEYKLMNGAGAGVFKNFNDLTIDMADEFNTLFGELNTAMEEADSVKTIAKIGEIYNLASKYNLDLSDTMEGHLADAEEKAMALQENLDTIAAANRSTVTSWMNLEYRSSSSNSIFNEVPELFNQAVEALYSEIQTEETPNFSRSHIANVASTLFQGVDNVLAGVTETRKKEIQDILSHPEQYSSSDIQQLIPELKDADWLLKTFENPIEYNKQQIEKKFDQISEDNLLSSNQLDLFKGIDLSNLTLNLRNLLTSGINQATALEKNGQNSTEFISQFIDFYNYAAGLPAQLRNSLIDQFESNGFTYEGLEQTQAWIDKTITEGDKFDLSGLKNTYIPNFSLSLQTMQSSLEDNLGDLETLFSDLSGGVKASKLDDAIASASKLGVTLTKDDFYADGEKMVLKYENFGQLLAGIQEKYSLKTENLTSMLNRAIGTDIDDNDTEYEYLTKDIDAIRSILGEEKYAEYYENGQLREGVDESQVIEEIHNAYDALNGEYQAYNNWVTFLSNQFTKNIDWQHGDYSSLEGTTEKSWKEGKNVVTGTAFDRIRYLAAHPGEMTETERDSTDLRNAVDTYQSGIKSLLSDITTKSADEIITNSNNYKGLAPEFVEQIAKDLQSGDLTVYKAIQLYAQEAGNTVAETNDLIVEAIEKNTLHGSTKAASELARGTFTLSNLNDYVTKYGVKQKDTNERNYSIDQFFDEAGQLTGPLSNVYQWDEASAAYKATGTLDDVIQAWEAALGVTLTKDSELYQELIQGWTSDAVKNADKADWGKQMASGISSLSSAKVGTRVDLSKSPELQAKLQELGYNVTDGYYEVVSEYARDSMILQLESTDAEVNATLRPLQEQIKQKRAKGAATQGIMGQTATREAFRNYLQYSKGVAGAATYQDSTIDAFAKLHGYVWDKDLQQYTATIEALTSADKEIQEAIESGASDEYIKQLREKRGELAAHFRKDEKRDALSNLLSNYKDAEDYIDEFNTQFGTDLEKLGIATLDQTTGKYKIDVDKLKTQFPEIAEKYQDLLDNWQDALVDEYINNISKAGSILTQGTTSQADISAFKEAYTELTKSTVDAFYDPILNAWTISATDMQTYIEAAANKLGLTGDAKTDYVNAQIKALTVDTLDFSKYLSGSASAEDEDILKRNLKNYYETHKPEEYDVWPIEDQLEWVETINKFVDDDLETLSQGGTDAVKKLQSYGKELSTEEIEAAYRAQVAPIKAVADSLNELKVNSVVAKNQIEILKTAGFAVDENGVVTAVGDMVQAYKSIYAQMKATGEATTAELNAALGTYLDNRDGEQQAIDALSNASSMTYSQFAEIFTNAGKELTEEMVNQYQASGMIKHLGGNKMMIADFDAFALEMGWSPYSEEYISAFKTYNDNIIEYNKRIGTNIKAEFDAVSGAKVGDEINLTETISQLDYYAEKEFSELMTAYGATLNNGILTLTESANIPMIAQEVGKIAVQQGGMTKNEFQAMMARLRTQDQSSIDTAFSSILSSYDSISIDLIESLAKSLKVDFASLIGAKGIFTDADNNGTYKLDTSQILSYIAWAKENVSNEVYNQLLNTVASLQDEALSSISTAANYNYNGISSIADMQAFVDKYNQLVDENAQIDIESAFEYDTINNTFKLNNTVLKSYIEQQRSVLEQLGLSGEALDEYIKDQTDTILRESIEIDNFLDASTSKERNDEANKLIQQIRGLSNYQDIQANAIMSAFNLDDATLALEELTHMTQEQIDLIILQTLESGGQDAVDLLKQIKPDASQEELETAFNSQINKLNDAMNQVGDLVAGQFIGTEGKLYEILSDIHAVDDNGVVVEGFKMVEAYARIYAEMKETATSTTADLNNAYVQLLTAQDQESVDLIEALNNASGMTYEAIGQIFTRYGIELEQALLNSEDAGIARVGYNKIAITDFTKFKGYIEKAIGHTIEVGTQEYLDAYSAYVDSQINMRNQGKNNLQTAFDQLKSVTEAKVGDLLNVTYLEDAFDKSTKTSKDTLVQIAEKFGASIKDGILTISNYTDIPGLLQAVAEEAGRAGLLIPEQLAELTDAVADMLSNITSLISNGITGTLNNTDALSLQNWAEKQGLQPLEFNQTVEGLQLTADSIAMVYAEMKRLNSLQAQSLLSTIIESNDRYSTLASTLQAAAEVTQRIDFTRATITNPRRTVMGDVGANGVALITPVLPDGTELGDDWAKTLATKYANGEINLTTKLQGSDGQELSYTLEDVSRGLYTAENAVQQATSAMQSYNAAAESAAGATEDFTASLDNLAAQSSLMSDIVLNKLTDPDAMNFMSDKLPDNYQVAINAWENASKAINTLTTAGKKGYIGVEDFYNIVNTSAGLLEAAGKEFNIKGMNAADLMEAACQHLKVVDGDLKIDLSSAGLDMVSGVDDLKNNLTDGIHELAAAEVAILDAEIQVLEVLAAMEAMGDMVVDVDNNGISFELNDMFTFDVDGNVKDFTEDMQAFLDQMNEAIATSDDLEKAVKAIQINGTTLYDLFQGTAKDWEKTFGSAEGASKFMQKLSNIDWGTDINTIQTQIVNAMKDLGQNLVIDVGDNGLVGITATGQLFNIDLDDKDVAKQAQQAVNAFRTDHPDFFEGTNLRDNVKQLINELNNPDSNQVQVDLQYTLKVITGEIKIEEEKNDKGQKTGKFVGEYAGVKFRADEISDVEYYIKQAIDLENQGLSKIEFNEETGEVSGTLNVGAARITVKKNGDETTFETDPPGYDGKGGVEGAVKWLAQQGYADNSLAGKTWSIDGTFYEVIQDNELGLTYTFTRSSDKNSWLYNGQTFTSYDEMAQYVRDIVPLEQGLSDDWHEKAGKQYNKKTGHEVKIWTNGTAEIEYDLETGKVTILADGIHFKSRAEADTYLAEKAMAEQQKDSGGEINDNTSGGKTIKYTTGNGDTYEVEYNSTEKVKTHVTMQNGYSFDAYTDAELSMGLAAAAAIAKQKAGELPELDGNQGTVKIKTPGGDYEVTIDDTGKVTVKDPQGKIDEALSEELTKKLEQSKIDTNLKNTISTAITEAFTSLKSELENLDTESITTLATALSTVSSAIDTLAKNKGIETFGKSIEDLKTDNFIAVTTAMDNMAKSLQTLATAADWVTLGIALALLNAALLLVSINSTAFDTLKEKVDALANDENFTTLQNKLQDIVNKLLKIKENKDIDIKISFDDGGALSKLQQLAELIDRLTGKDVNVNVNTSGDTPSNGLTDPRKFNLPDPSKYNLPNPSAESTPQGTLPSFANGDGPINPNLQNEVVKIQTEFDQPTNSVDPPANPVEVPVEYNTENTPQPENPEPAEQEVTYTNSEIPEVEVPEAEGEVNWKNGETPETPTIPDAEGKVNWVNGSTPAPPSFTATGVIHWQSAAAGNFIFHKYLKRDKPAVDKPGTKNRQDTVQATGNAFAGGTPTLMGELGPELVVSKGRYGLVGLNGPEFVSLDKDAIVFNHLQTESLMTKGVSKERGRAVTNERNAVAFATGNINGGPAKASASAALAVLKQLRAMWESLQNASVSDLAGAAGGGGGGGGGSDDDTSTPEEWVALVERWYNLTQEIAKLEKEITHEEELRSKLQGDFSKNGKAYYQSQKRSLQALKDQIQAQEQLNLSRENYFDQRRAALEKTPLGNIYEFDEKGQMKFKDNLNPKKFNGHTNSFDFLQDLYGYDKNGKANYTNKQKYEIMQKAGLGEYMLYDSDGTKINKDDFDDEDEYYKTVTQQVKDRIDDYASATQSLWDEIQTGKDDLLKLQQAENEILQEMRDNQMEVEDKVLDAIEDMKQREIDALQDERDKLEESVGKYIDGLSNALDNEQKMYETQDSQNELDTKKRRLGILQRSGASAADVSALQDEILQAEKDLYFNAQQAQIDAIQEASDLEIARLDSQIAIMQETLDYQKEFGLLWYQVYDVMQGSAEQITTFIMGQNSEFWSQSPLKNATDANDILFQATQWQEYREDISNANDSLVTIATASQREIQEKDYKIFDEAMKKEFGNDYDKNGKYKDLFNEEYANGEHAGDITEVSATVRATYTHDAALAKRKKEAGQYWTHTGPDRYISINDTQHWHYKYKEETIEGVTGYYFTSKTKEDHEWKNEKCTKCGHKKPAPQSSGGGWNGGGSSSSGCGSCSAKCGGNCTDFCQSSCWDSCGASCKSGCGSKNTSGRGKASGGYVTHGTYELGELGTETVLNAQQTRVLRNNILSNRPNSLISLLKTYNEGFSRMGNPLVGTPTTEDNSTNIETVELNMNVQQIANDYDARRAGEQALSEIMRIARKTSAANSIRR